MLLRIKLELYWIITSSFLQQVVETLFKFVKAIATCVTVYDGMDKIPAFTINKASNQSNGVQMRFRARMISHFCDHYSAIKA